MNLVAGIMVIGLSVAIPVTPGLYEMAKHFTDFSYVVLYFSNILLDAHIGIICFHFGIVKTIPA